MTNLPTCQIDKRASLVAHANRHGDDDQLLTSAEAAKILGCSKAWLESKRVAGATPPGPPHCHPFGNRIVRYRRGDLLAWVKARDAAYRAQLGEAAE